MPFFMENKEDSSTKANNPTKLSFKPSSPYLNATEVELSGTKYCHTVFHGKPEKNDASVLTITSVTSYLS